MYAYSVYNYSVSKRMCTTLHSEHAKDCVLHLTSMWHVANHLAIFVMWKIHHFKDSDSEIICMQLSKTVQVIT